jgi:sugar diacid utilization regulator
VRRYVAARAIERPVEVPVAVTAEAPIAPGGRRLGAVVLMGPARSGAATTEVLHFAAAAAVTAVAVEEGAEHAAGRARAALLDDARADTHPDPLDLLARAQRLGCNLAAGGMALSVDLATTHAHRARAAVGETFPDALTAVRDGRLSAVLPARQTGATATVDAALRLARRLPAGVAFGLARFAEAPVDLHRLVREAEIARLLGARGAIDPLDVEGGTYRLLVSLALTAPGAVEAFRDETLGPVLDHDARLGTGLVSTFADYLRNGCNMNATAAVMHAHRHTVAYRLERLHQLTGLDPHDPEDRERLGLALKARDVADAVRAP